jgi:hypothetical protein
MESLRQKQSRFARMVFGLGRWLTANGFEVTLGDAWAKDGHKPGSLHYIRLAIDLNLFKNGEFLTKTEDHLPAGEYWESIGGTWGGRFEDGDGNHYSLEHEGRR